MNAAKIMNVGTVARSNVTSVILGFNPVTGALVVRDIKFIVGILIRLFSLIQARRVHE